MTSLDWWEQQMDREQFAAKAQQEAQRMSASKIGRWIDTTTALDSPWRKSKGMAYATHVPKE